MTHTLAIHGGGAIIPVAQRTTPTTVAFDAATMGEVIGWVNTVSALSSFLR